MAFDNDTNRGRVQKMVDTLDLLRKSAQSNRVEPAEVSGMLRPVSDKLAGMCIEVVTEVAQTKPRKGAWGASAPQWASVHDMAVSADLDDLGGAMIVYLERCADDRANQRER